MSESKIMGLVQRAEHIIDGNSQEGIGVLVFQFIELRALAPSLIDSIVLAIIDKVPLSEHPTLIRNAYMKAISAVYNDEIIPTLPKLLIEKMWEILPKLEPSAQLELAFDIQHFTKDVPELTDLRGLAFEKLYELSSHRKGFDKLDTLILVYEYMLSNNRELQSSVVSKIQSYISEFDTTNQITLWRWVGKGVDKGSPLRAHALAQVLSYVDPSMPRNEQIEALDWVIDHASGHPEIKTQARIAREKLDETSSEPVRAALTGLLGRLAGAAASEPA